ncbi:MAG: polyketide cyclase [Planctomycetota bacterium]
MAGHVYEFVSFWNVMGTREEVYDVLINSLDYPRWWSEVFLMVKETWPGGEHGLGKVEQVLTRGRLPYTFRWTMAVKEVHYPDGFTVQAAGDFNGDGMWSLSQHGPAVTIRCDWRINFGKPLLRYLAFLMKPFLRANHRWAMRRGSEALRVELLRRRSPRASF